MPNLEVFYDMACLEIWGYGHDRMKMFLDGKKSEGQMIKNRLTNTSVVPDTAETFYRFSSSWNNL